ncbi:unnamed protein product [Mytilus edulis]|uniref:B box-type domain-containing protein n=1 Tax=Mytilus edulis TaxID=6550 RepID=A0A8S3VKL3_MYTED|nr:unnamed protein product [Mytilus edulis]
MTLNKEIFYKSYITGARSSGQQKMRSTEAPVMASSKPIQCGPCQEGTVQTKADIWCNNCDEGLCSTCSGHHKRSKLSRHHKTIDINIHKPSIHAIKTVCDKHYQQLNLYCTGHLMPCCDECISTITTKSSKLHSFLEVHQIEQQVHQCQRFVEDLEDDDRAKELEIKLKHNEEIDELLCKLESLESLGEVIVDKIEIAEENRGTSVRRGAQINDMICLMDGRVIISQDTGEVNLLTPDGKLEKQFTISGEANSVTQINQDIIAITYYNERAIKMFNMEKETVTKVIKLDKVCWGLSFSNNSFAVGLDNNEIRIIDLEGNTLKSIPVQSKTILDFVVHCNDRVIYSDYEGKAIYCVDESGTQIWKYKQELSFPAGLCTDSYGNIFVADYGPRSIIVISKDEKDSKALINEEDRPKKPWCICFKHNESSGFICDYLGTNLTKFNLSCR